MSESFIHYVWQLQYYNNATLRSALNEEITVFEPGIYNTNAGPDFYNARIKIDDVEWVGCVEVHINSSDWYQHNHAVDDAYENVILHVVWKNDKEVRRKDGTLLPVLELKDRIDQQLLLGYKKLINSGEKIACAPLWKNISDLKKISMFDRAVTNRLEKKALDVLAILKRNQNDWQETMYQLLAKNFGFKVNAEPFLQLAQSVPYKLLLKHSDQLIQVEALLLGQAGLLEQKDVDDEYFKLLKREYNLLSQKYQLSERCLNKSQWKFLRLRPANFPTIRIAQFAKLIFDKKNIFSDLLEAKSYKDFDNLLKVDQSTYWRQHYTFGKVSAKPSLALGESSVHNILINSVAPLLTAYGKFKDDYSYVERALVILQSIPAETNIITRQWEMLEVKNKTSFDSQACIELYNNFCLKRRCLDCHIGASLLKPVSV